MINLDLTSIALLAGTAFIAGFVDSIAGGGGLVTVPALILAGFDPVTAIATNKVQGTLSIVSALVTYGRRGLIQWRESAPMALIAFCAGIIGALCVHILPKEMISGLIPGLLIAVALYFGFSPRVNEADSHSRWPRWMFLVMIIPPIAFYDGFFGPGAGSFYALALIALQGYGLIRTTALSKVLNGGSNVGALALFTLTGAVLWPVGLIMGAFSILGAQIGSRLALRNGAKIIKPLIVVVCCAIAVRLLLDPANPLRVFVLNRLIPG